MSQLPASSVNKSFQHMSIQVMSESQLTWCLSCHRISALNTHKQTHTDPFLSHYLSIDFHEFLQPIHDPNPNHYRIITFRIKEKKKRKRLFIFSIYLQCAIFIWDRQELYACWILYRWCRICTSIHQMVSDITKFSLYCWIHKYFQKWVLQNFNLSGCLTK